MILSQKSLSIKEFNTFFSQQYAHKEGRRYLEYYVAPWKSSWETVTTIHTYVTPWNTWKSSWVTYLFLKTYFHDFFSFYQELLKTIISVDGYLGITLSSERFELISMRIGYHHEIEKNLLKIFPYLQSYFDKKYCFFEIRFWTQFLPNTITFYSKSSTWDIDMKMIEQFWVQDEDIFLIIYGDTYNIENNFSTVTFSHKIKSLKLFESKNNTDLELFWKKVYINAIDIIGEEIKLRCTTLYMSEEL